MNWTKVEDELPKVGMLCLLKKTYPPGTMFNLLAHPLPRCHIVIGGLRYDRKFISYEDQYSDGITVSHWMPLPKPPEKS